MENVRSVHDLVLEYADEPMYFLLTGSSVICDPPVIDTDFDFVVVYCGRLSENLQSRGFVISPHEEYPNQEIKACYRRGNDNVIAVSSTEDWNRWKLAHELAKHMNLLEKQQRVVLFQFITEGTVRGTNISSKPSAF